ncbi:MAG: cation transporter [Dethiobacter sp.]|jgi:cation diffusion facilitator family transporter|nr:MAG: cation transporter [Dethiobacter sp.]
MKENISSVSFQRYRRGKRAIFLNIVINLSLALFKGFIGYFSRSQAMLADAFNSGGDLLVNFVVLTGLKTAHRPADEEHPYGHGKAETLAQNGVGLLIMATGLFLAISSLKSLGTILTEPPGSFALVAAIISLVIKEILFRYMWILGKKVNSRALLANAWDHRSDVFSSLAVLTGIGGARLGSYLGYPFLYYLDSLAGVLVSMLIIYTGMSIMKDAGNELMDGMCSPETMKEITSIARGVPRVKEIQQVRVRGSGPCLLVDLEIGVDGFLSVEEGHDVAHALEEKLLYEKEEIIYINVHIGPCRG